MRRIAPQLADLFARHGVAASVEATVTGRTRTSYRVPLLLGTPAGPVLVDGDLDSPAVDDGTVLRLYLMAVDCGAKALFLHAGAVAYAAREYRDRVTLWPRAEAVALLGETLWNAAVGAPLPTLPGPLAGLGRDPEPVEPAFPAVPEAAVVAEPAVVAESPVVTEPAVVMVPESQAPIEPEVEVQAIAEAHEDLALPAPPSGAPAEPFIDLDDGISDTPAMDLETGVDVVVTTLPTTVADELSTAEPLTALAPTTVAEALPPAFQSEAPATQAAPLPSRPEAPLFEMPPAFRADLAVGPALPVPEGSRGLLPASVTLEEARRSVADRLFGIDEWELILQPVHLFDYAVEVLRAGSLQADTQRGRLQVNGTDRKVSPTDPDAADPAKPARVFASDDLTVMDKVLRVSPERAEQVAHEWATATYGKTVHVNMAGADDSFDLTERKTIGPTSGQVKLGYLGVYHRPFWRLWGGNGHVDLDAVEGHVLDQELKTVDPDFLVVE